ncbi:MAG: hypothetical protein ACXWCB_18320, partial [Acidimicrobiales bacterium]
QRVQELTAVTELLAAPVPAPEPSVVDAHIEAALAAHAAATASPAPAGSSAPADVDRSVRPAVASLADRRRRPAVGRWLAVAAAIAVIALAIPVLRSLSDSSSRSSDTAASVSASTDSANGAEAAGNDQAQSPAQSDGRAAPTTTPAKQSDAAVGATSGGDLGSADTDLALTALVQQAAPDATGHPTTQSSTAYSQLDSSTTTTPPLTRSTGPSCDGITRASHPELGALRYSATATYQSVPVEVAVYEVPDPTTVTYRLIATATDDCRVLVDRTYP